MCKVILAKYKMYSTLGIFFFVLWYFICTFFSFRDVILISCHSLVLFHCKHYCAKCTVFKRMWMCIVSEPNKYNDVKSCFWVLLSILSPGLHFISLVSGKVAVMKLIAFWTLVIPNPKPRQGFNFSLILWRCTKVQMTICASSPCPPLSGLCISGTANQKRGGGLSTLDASALGCLGMKLPWSAGRWPSNTESTSFSAF